MSHYILDENKKPTPVVYSEWIEWVKNQPTDYYVVAKDKIGEANVSTVFLHGINHSYEDDELELWETMIFPNCDYCERYSSYEEALNGHQRAIEHLKKADG